MRPTSRLTKRQSKAFLERQRMRLYITIGVAVAVIAIWLFNAVRLTHVAVFSIERIEVTGADAETLVPVVLTARASLEGSYAGLFARSSSFFYPASQMAAALTAVSPRIQSVSLARQGWQTLKIDVHEKTPAAVVCTSLPDFSKTIDASLSGDCYEADTTGLLFKPETGSVPGATNRYFMPDLADTEASTTLVGTLATSTPEFAALQSFYSGARHLGLGPEAILSKGSGEYELYIQGKSASDTASSSDEALVVVYFNDSQSFSDQLSNLGAFWSKKQTDRGSGAMPTFESIDLRYGANVFYRLSQ